MTSKNINILLVDEDDVDVELLRRQFEQNNIAHPITHIDRAHIALAVLRGEGGYKRLERPYIIVLELMLGWMTGLQFLKELRQDEALKRSVVVVLTASDYAPHRIEAYNYNVAAYMRKDDVHQDFSLFINLLKLYETMELPM